MTANIAVGLLLTAVTVALHSVGLVALTEWIQRASRLRTARILTMTVLCSGLVVLLGVEIALWGIVFLWLGVLPDLATSFYFSTSSFATIGFGDVVPAHEWRLLAAVEGVVGFLIIGWSSAYLVAAGIRFGPFERNKHF
jgi:hypothetical protein